MSSCSNPLYGYYHLGDLTPNGKQAYDIFHKRQPIRDASDWWNCVELPCGKCLGCRISRSREWSVRCMHEASLHEHNWYITLTYNEENVPFTELTSREYEMCSDEFSHEIWLKEHITDRTFVRNLDKEDWRKFIKALRQHFKRKYNHDGIRFYMCGEYGDGTLRPHMHAIIFNLPLDDLLFFKKNEYGDPIYISKTLHDIWHRGFVYVEDVTERSCAYVAGYCTKKLGDTDKRVYEEMQREFTLSSRRPGLGRLYYENHKNDIFIADEVHLKGKKYKPPRYYDKLLEAEDPYRIGDIKNTRALKVGIDKVNRNVNDDEYRKLCALNLKKMQKNKKRDKFTLEKPETVSYNRIIQNKYFVKSKERKRS